MGEGGDPETEGELGGRRGGGESCSGREVVERVVGGGARTGRRAGGSGWWGELSSGRGFVGGGRGRGWGGGRAGAVSGRSRRGRRGGGWTGRGQRSFKGEGRGTRVVLVDACDKWEEGGGGEE